MSEKRIFIWFSGATSCDDLFFKRSSKEQGIAGSFGFVVGFRFWISFDWGVCDWFEFWVGFGLVDFGSILDFCLLLSFHIILLFKNIRVNTPPVDNFFSGQGGI